MTVPSRFDAIDDIFDEPFVLDRARLGHRAMIAIETGRDPLRKRGVRQQVAGDLFDDELVVPHVFVERVDDPVAPRRHVPREIVLVTVRVGKPGAVEPIGCHSLAIVRRLEQLIDQLFVRSR